MLLSLHLCVLYSVFYISILSAYANHVEYVSLLVNGNDDDGWYRCKD